MRYRVLWIFALAAALFQAGCSNQTSPTPVKDQPAVPATDQASAGSIALMVFASSSLTQSFTELAILYEAQHPDVRVSFNFQNANTLAQQIEAGAPADVFASAAEKFMTNAVGTGRINQDDVRIFALNKLVVIYPKNNPAHLQTLADLVKPGIKLVIGAKEGPQGIYVDGFLSNVSRDAAFSATYKDDFYKNVVSYESTVNGVVTKVSLGEADAGIAFYSDSQGTAAEKVGTLEILDAFNIKARYPIAVLNDSQNLALAKAFVDLVMFPTGQEVLKKYGFVNP